MREVCAEFLGEVTEWPNVRDWKSRVGQKPTGGSNPPLSAFITGQHQSQWILMKDAALDKDPQSIIFKVFIAVG